LSSPCSFHGRYPSSLYQYGPLYFHPFVAAYGPVARRRDAGGEHLPEVFYQSIGEDRYILRWLHDRIDELSSVDQDSGAAINALPDRCDQSGCISRREMDRLHLDADRTEAGLAAQCRDRKAEPHTGGNCNSSSPACELNSKASSSQAISDGQSDCQRWIAHS
jgi:hypothetical protein